MIENKNTLRLPYRRDRAGVASHVGMLLTFHDRRVRFAGIVLDFLLQPTKILLIPSPTRGSKGF